MIIRRITEQEMLGLIRGQCVPGNMKVNESLSGYLSRAFSAGADAQEKLFRLERQCLALLTNIAHRYPGQGFTCEHIQAIAKTINFEVKHD